MNLSNATATRAGDGHPGRDLEVFIREFLRDGIGFRIGRIEKIKNLRFFVLNLFFGHRPFHLQQLVGLGLNDMTAKRRG